MSKYTPLTLELVRDAAAEIVKDNPDKIVTVCAYAHPQYEGPSCLVGAILWKLGWSYKELEHLDSFRSQVYGSAVSSQINRGEVLVDSRETAEYLQELQNTQDRGSEWLEAYRDAEARLPLSCRDLVEG